MKASLCWPARDDELKPELVRMLADRWPLVCKTYPVAQVNCEVAEPAAKKPDPGRSLGGRKYL